MNTTRIGRDAEDAAATQLLRLGYEIIARNWRNLYCEIDIVAKKENVIYFCEVKYRTSLSQGGGLDYITPKKLKQMKFAAEFWCSENKWDGDVRLLAIAVTFDGTSLRVDDPIDVS